MPVIERKLISEVAGSFLIYWLFLT